MKVTLNGIKALNETYKCTGDITKIGIDKLIDKIGGQLGAIEEVIDLGAKYQGIVIVKVVKCDKHPDADKLTVCKIDDAKAVKDMERDSDGLVQVVCGAPNVREGFVAAWLPPGSTVPATVGKDPFVLEAREIRGQKSNGMLASPKELALGDSHEGLLELDAKHQPGTDFAEAFKLAGETVLDIENKMFTHRPDCFGWLGIDRELAGIQGMAFKSPGWYALNPAIPKAESQELKLEIKNELPQLVPRFTAIAMSDVQVGLSPVWLQVALAKAGQKSINNIVDLTNFNMLLTGQPLHAYDYDKVKERSQGEATIVVRNPKPGEKAKLLNGKEIEPHAETVMIATDKELIGMGGVMGGADTEVDQGTKNIIIESANFDMYATRRTSMRHGLFTDAVTRFTKGQSPLQTLAVLAKTVSDVERIAGGKVASPVIDNNHVPEKTLQRGTLHPPISLSSDFINARLGLALSATDMKKLLENVEFQVELKGDELTVTAPFWRIDIELREDVVEEVGRLYGYDKLPLDLPKRDLTPAVKDPLLATKAQIRDRLSRAGANELLTYSFVHENLLSKVGQDKAKAFQISNALSPDLQYYRLSLVPSLLEKVHPNIKAGYDEFALFELGKTHSTDHGDEDDGLPREFEFTALVVTANDKLKKAGAAYYEAVKYLEALAGSELSFKPISDDMLQYPVVQPYAINRAALVSIKGGDFLGIVGEFKPSVVRSLKLPKRTAGFEIDTTVLVPHFAAGPSYLPLFRFPSVKQDLTLKVPVELTYEEVYDFVDKALGANAPDGTHIRLETVDIYQAPDDKAHHNLTFRVTITGTNRTLTDKEVTGVLDAIAAAAQEKLNAERV